MKRSRPVPVGVQRRQAPIVALKPVRQNYLLRKEDTKTCLEREDVFGESDLEPKWAWSSRLNVIQLELSPISSGLLQRRKN